MRFAVIDCNEKPMNPDYGRGQGFVQALAGWELGRDYEFVRYNGIPGRTDELMQCRGLILSGSVFDLADRDGRFDQARYRLMAPAFELIRQSHEPVLGICFGHQLMALGDEFDAGRTHFGALRIGNMRVPRDRHRVALVRMNRPLRFMGQRDLWVQYNHKQEVVLNDGLLKYYEIIARSEQCPVEIMQHRSREWYGVQFHPEVGKETEEGEVGCHGAAEEDGQALLQEFVRYCLQR
jgi:GMP synthase-like glutamine amidotransferase